MAVMTNPGVSGNVTTIPIEPVPAHVARREGLKRATVQPEFDQPWDSPARGPVDEGKFTSRSLPGRVACRDGVPCISSLLRYLLVLSTCQHNESFVLLLSPLSFSIAPGLQLRCKLLFASSH